ncbi:caspase family protein [Methylobacterium nodulans]|uniref:Peptidase C14 caspase catalytic subunit p20 n=1 Tax=Methylobacterium nodulans (strain LMG 21967 / CNCM I-2342 / ORS 2060) TaxID=460265 RepID=B8IP28_METNO|nr:caspase domain-containing protein [Methylobacterium nodulans]ACL60346.1 peptidase C14 caspase catalytic subunit p20 [Methylobacterium nodulans ORS 2060]
MPQAVRIVLLMLAAAVVLPLAAPLAAPAETRIALVIGNGAYAAGALPTAANDAGLVAQTLQAAGFDVVGARDLDEDGLRRALRDFTDKAAAAGPEAVAFVYLSGYGLQLEGENYFAPVDARIATASDVPLRTLRVSDYARRLAALPLRARFLVLDAARKAPFRIEGDPLAGGLALSEAEPGSLVAFNAAPGTVGPDETGPYGAYARALVEMMREGGLNPGDLFERVRLRVSETTGGAELPWHSARIEAPFVFFERAPDAPPLARQAGPAADRRPLAEIGPQEAFARCIARDTLAGYEEFLGAYPQDPLANRVRAIVAARREAVTWRRSRLADTPDAYWSYLGRYPRGPHAWDARRRLRQLAAAAEPPPHFAALAYDVPPPPPEEVVYLERPALVLDDPAYDLPPPPVYLPPRPAFIADLPPPPPVVEEYVLPVPAFVPVPAYIRPPQVVAAPPGNVIYEHLHDAAAIERINAANAAPARAGLSGSTIAAGVAGAAIGAAVARVALPPSVSQKAALRPSLPAGPASPATGQRVPGPAPGAQPGRFGPQGQPVPQQAGRPNGPAAPGQALPVPGAIPPGQQAGRPAPAAPQPALRPQGPAAASTAAPGPAAGQPLPSPARQAIRPVPGPGEAAPGAPPAQPRPAQTAPRQGAQPHGPGRPIPAAPPPNPPGPALARPPAAPAAHPQAEIARRQQLQQEQAAQAQRAAAQRQQQMMMQQRQQQAVQAAARQQQLAAQAAAHRQQMMQQQAAQAAARQQQMMQQQAAARQQQQLAAQRQQMMQQRQQPVAPRPAPGPHPAPGGGGRPCGHPGQPPCR